MSVSTKARELIETALEWEEDLYLSELAKERSKAYENLKKRLLP